MQLHVIAVGTRMPDWVESAFGDYARRLRSSYRLRLTELPTAGRGAAADPARAVADEGRRLLMALDARDFVVALDERGREPATLDLARWLEERRQSGLDLAFLIGGPDGLAPEVLARAHYQWSLSRLTLPHALVRVLLVEQLYRASTLLAGHPYHRQ